MHNFLLGTAKYLVNHWKVSNIISSDNFQNIQATVNDFVSPSDIGRIPLKISSGFSGFTADQWRNWIVFYSLVTLKSILPFRQYNNWHLFVKACHLLCRRNITEEQLIRADQLLLSFCKGYIDL